MAIKLGLVILLELRDGRTIDLRLRSYKLTPPTGHTRNNGSSKSPIFTRLLLTTHKVVTTFDKLAFVECLGEDISHHDFGADVAGFNFITQA